MITCSSCNKFINGSILRALNTTWHQECFSCHNCNISLVGTSFFPKDNYPYCEKCYSKLFIPKCTICTELGQDTNEILSTQVDLIRNDDKIYCRKHFTEKFGMTCDYCKKQITSTPLVADGKPFHVDHFVCQVCEEPITSSYSILNDIRHCPNCSKSSMTCFVCNKSIVLGSYVEFENKPAHSDCFKCSTCQKSLGSGSFYETSLGYTCKPCYLDSREQSKCFSCSQSISEGSSFSVSKEDGTKLSFHEACYVCSTCQKPLPGSRVKIDGQKVLCSECYIASSCEKCGICHKFISDGGYLKLNQIGSIHESCFKCSVCNEIIKSSYTNLDGEIYCPSCTQKAMDVVKKTKKTALQSASNPISPKQKPTKSQNTSQTSKIPHTHVPSSTKHRSPLMKTSNSSPSKPKSSLNKPTLKRSGSLHAIGPKKIGKPGPMKSQTKTSTSTNNSYKSTNTKPKSSPKRFTGVTSTVISPPSKSIANIEPQKPKQKKKPSYYRFQGAF